MCLRLFWIEAYFLALDEGFAFDVTQLAVVYLWHEWCLNRPRWEQLVEFLLQRSTFLCQGCVEFAGFLLVEGPTSLTYTVTNLSEAMLEGNALLRPFLRCQIAITPRSPAHLAAQ